MVHKLTQCYFFTRAGSIVLYGKTHSQNHVSLTVNVPCRATGACLTDNHRHPVAVVVHIPCDCTHCSN